jgi:uncharacterized PurR-regulated membrane protein YhhQ (DUF165 family)
MSQSTLAAAKFKIPTGRDRLVAYASASGLLVSILAANFVTSTYGIVPVGFGLMATAGTYFAGLTFVLRDAFQDTAGQAWTLAVIAAGAALSFVLADPFIALASAVAFVSSEVADLVVYTPLRKRGYIRAAVASNVVGSFVDTVIFLSIAGFPIQDAIGGQMVGKLVVTAIAIAAVVAFRLLRISRAEAA